ncbi:hypothetical protein ASF88_19615 [Leifsonia sp. Leaf336]|uniref:hypothetical protein n=1 Tax=Leifsonia sp. Leaf336 TaxID=1736341 RepID=UPI0006FB3093|nr:hypothetical protein [Leifsonia sp. Leaf336]KQR51368.1 hypothetical protein ASF88_19615 [Leifsonia sp. Leaf336]
MIVMQVFIIDTRNMGPELQGGIIGVVGSLRPSPEEKSDCIETVSRYVVDGWAVAADPSTPIGRLAALTAEAACVPFVRVGGARMPQWPARTIEATRSPERDFADPHGSPFPALAPDTRIRGVGQGDSRNEIGGR